MGKTALPPPTGWTFYWASRYEGCTQANYRAPNYLANIYNGIYPYTATNVYTYPFTPPNTPPKSITVYGPSQPTSPLNECLPNAPTSAGIMVGMCDGSVRVVTPGISMYTWYLVNNPQDGLPLGADW